MKKTAIVLSILFLISGMTATDALSSIVSISPPTSVVQGQLESDWDGISIENRVINLFEEQQNVWIDSLSVDITSPGTYTRTNNPPGGNVEETYVNSYFLHFDPEGEPSDHVGASGSWTFNQTILGIILLDETLDASDSSLGNTGTSYPTGTQWRGIEIGLGQSGDDSITLESDGKTLNLNLVEARSVGIEQIRVITAVPIPATLLLFGSGIIGFVGIIRRLKH